MSTDNGPCKNYADCMNTEMNNLEYPVDQQSLYADRFYDEQTAKKRCYEKNKPDITEGFGFNNLNIKNIIKWIIIIVIVYYAINFILGLNKEKVGLNINTPAFGGSDSEEFLKQLLNQIN